MTTIKAERVEVELDVALKCSECGVELDGEYTENISYGHVYRELSIGPCQKCIDSAVKEAGPSPEEDENAGNKLQ